VDQNLPINWPTWLKYCAMEQLDAGDVDSDLFTVLGELGDNIGAEGLERWVSPNQIEQRKVCNSCKKLLCSIECFDGNLKTCRGCLRVRRTYQRKKRKEKLREAIRREVVSEKIPQVGKVQDKHAI